MRRRKERESREGRSGWANENGNANTQTIRVPLRPWLHGRIILTLMYLVLMRRAPLPNQMPARSLRVEGGSRVERRGQGLVPTHLSHTQVTGGC